MIKNQRQYLITKAQVARLDAALRAHCRESGDDERVHPVLRKAEADALRSQIDELHGEMSEYEALVSGKKKILEADSFEELPRVLVQARIAAGLTQKELAARVGLKEQQIQRYEATDYASASVSRISEIISALGIQIRKEVFLPDSSRSVAEVVERVRQAGIGRDLMLSRLLPRSISSMVTLRGSEPSTEPGSLAVRAAAYVGRVFGWSPGLILGNSPLSVGAAPLGEVRFKASSRVAERQFTAYTVYAHYLALLLLEATSEAPMRRVPTDAQEFRDNLGLAHGEADLQNALLCLWGLGVPVLPLDDPGAFHSACWRVGGRTAIVLKQRTHSQARWLFDLLHEVYHAGQQPEREERTHVETAEEWQAVIDDDEEQEANQFAGNVILDNRAEELAQRCVEAAKGRVEFLKAALPRVAAEEQVSAGALANYMAFRLSLQGINWWGTANNLQAGDESPFAVARDILLAKANLDRLNDLDRQLLLQALSDVEGQGNGRSP